MLQELKDKIIKAVPEIMELKFGCKFKYGSDSDCRVINVYSNMHDDRIEYIAYLDDNFNERRITGEDFNYNKTVEILGRDITLEDVMMTLPEDKILKITSNKKAVIFLKRILLEGGYLEHAECKWLLGKPLHLQPKETIKSLNELI